MTKHYAGISSMTMPEYFSQFGEDYFLSEFFKHVKMGYCVEVGANDGINDSTTYYFERQGWNCLLIEPNPELCETIRKKRSSKLFEGAASDTIGKTTLLVAEGSERAHGVSALSSQERSKETISSYGFTFRPVQVITNTLDNILLEADIKAPIHFISIDVEGHELNVLKGFSLENWKPTIMIIEDNSNFEDTEIRDYLRPRGYTRFKRTGVNDWYAHHSNKQLVTIFSVATYLYKCNKEKLKTRLKRIPGLVDLVRQIKKSLGITNT